MEKKQFSLVPTENGGTYQLDNFEDNLEIVKNFVAERTHDYPIEDGDDLQYVKAMRTQIRKRVDLIAEARKAVNKTVLGTFNDQLKQIEKVLKDADSSLKGRVDAYKASQRASEEKADDMTIRWEIYGTDVVLINRAITYAQSLGLEAKEIK